MNKLILNAVGVVVVVFLMVFGVYAQTKSAPVISTFKDSRDGKTYKKVTIGGKTWMAQNLNFAAEGSKCHGEEGEVMKRETDGLISKKVSNAELQENCVKYGRLYDWNTALKVCPAGWHLPSSVEWRELRESVGGGDNAGTKLKSTSGWIDYKEKSGNGTDDYGFSALPGGGVNGYEGEVGFWWSSTENHQLNSTQWVLDYRGESLGYSSGYKDDLNSVRCVQD